MATIQIRNVPDDVYRTYRLRAGAAGMSLQEYLLTELSENARLRSPADLVAEVEQRMRSEGSAGFARVGSAGVLGDDRTSH